MCLLSEVYSNKRDARSSTNIMEIDVGANLACRYFPAKNSEPAGKPGGTRWMLLVHENRDQRPIIS